jgi:hypothetical protein
MVRRLKVRERVKAAKSLASSKQNIFLVVLKGCYE